MSPRNVYYQFYKNAPPAFPTNIDHPEASKIIYLGSYKHHYQYQFQLFRMIGRDFHFEAFIFKYICSHLKKYKRQSSSAERWQERKRMSFLKAPKTQVSGKPCWRGRVSSCWTSTQAGPAPPPPSTSSSTSSTSNFRCSSSQTKSCQVKTGKEVKFLSVNCYAVPELEMFKGQCHPVFVMISQGKTTYKINLYCNLHSTNYLWTGKPVSVVHGSRTERLKVKVKI